LVIVIGLQVAIVDVQVRWDALFNANEQRTVESNRHCDFDTAICERCIKKNDRSTTPIYCIYVACKHCKCHEVEAL